MALRSWVKTTTRLVTVKWLGVAVVGFLGNAHEVLADFFFVRVPLGFLLSCSEYCHQLIASDGLVLAKTIEDIFLNGNERTFFKLKVVREVYVVLPKSQCVKIELTFSSALQSLI